METNASQPHQLKSILLIFAIIFAVYTGARVTEVYNVISGNYPREISVTGEAIAYVVPDTALIRLGITAEGKTAKDVMEKNTSKMKSIVDDLKSLTIEADKIQTTQFSLNPRYTYPENQSPRIDGYELRQEIQIRLNNFDLIGKTIESATANGANTVGDLQFVVDNKDEALKTARAEAIQKAKAKAELLEEQTGLNFKQILSYWEDIPSEPQPYADGRGGMGGGGIMMEKSMAPSIEPGSEQVQVRVTLSYRVR